MKYQVKATAPTVYQLQSVSLFGSPIKSNMEAITFKSEIFDTEQEAKEYLIKRAEMYFDSDEKELNEAINDINKYGSLRMDAASGGIYEVEEEEYFVVYDKEDIYDDDECLCSFDTEEEARDFVTEENKGYGYNKLFYKAETKNV